MAKRIKHRSPANRDERAQMVEQLIGFGALGLEDSQVVQEYNRGIRYWKGNHDIRDRDASRGNKVYNKFAEIVETRLAHLTDAKPKWLFRPQESNDIALNHILNQIMGDVVWDYINWDKGEDGGGKGEDAMIQAFFAGSCHIKTALDTHNGYPNFHVMPAGSFIPDPKAKSKKQLRYWIHLVMVSVEHIKKQYGVELAPQIDLEKLKSQDRADFHRPQITAQLDTSNDTMPSVPFKIGKEGISAFGNDPMGRAVVSECWMEDYTMEAIPYEASEVTAEHDNFKAGGDAVAKADQHHPKHLAAHKTFLKKLDGATESQIIQLVQRHIDFHEQFDQTTSRRKYPYGRVLTVSQGQVLSDRPNPFGKLGLDFRDVLLKFDYYKNPEGYWGKPGSSDLFDPQDDINHRKNAITQNVNLMNNGIRKIKWQLYEKLGIKNNPERLNNLAAQVVPFINSPDEFTTDHGQAMPHQIWADIAWTERFMDTQSLNNDGASGRLPAAGTANSTLETLLGEFKTILRKPLRHYASALSEMGRNAVLIMSEYMDDEEKFLILGEDQKTYSQIQWGDIRNRAALIRNVRIDTTNMLPTSRQESFRRVIEMMQSGVPPEAAMQLLDDPKAIQVMHTMSQINQLKAAFEQQGQENEQLKQQLNTVMNRLQGVNGAGNVGIFNTDT